MNNKEKYLCLFLGFASVFLLGLTFFNNKINFNSMLKASISEVGIQNNVLIDAAKKMAQNNIDKLKKENVYTVKELIDNKYLTGNEIDPNTNKEYDENIRVVVLVKNGQIDDAFISNVLFKNKLSCDNVCYLDSDNYIYFNNDTYRILKIDQQGYVYITKNDVKKKDRNDIDLYFKKIKKSIDNRIVSDVISVSDKDIEKSNIIELENNVVVDTNEGYKLYNIDKGSIQNIDSKIVNLYPIIVLSNDITYESGNGSKFSPYIIGE